MLLGSVGTGSRSRERRLVLIFLLGLMAGGAATAIVIVLLSGLFSWIPGLAAALAIFLVAAMAFAHDTGIVNLRLPTNPQMIPQQVFHRSLSWGMFRFAAELGSGIRTYISSAGEYALGVTLLLLGSWIAIPLVVVGWAIGRWIPIVSGSVVANRSLWNSWIDRWARAAPVVGSAMFLGAAAGYLLRVVV